ncbi:hypothetical protein Tco_1163901 [Tanacetum coccineum]
MICNMDSIGKYMLEIILHQQRTPQLLKQKKLMQTQEDHSNPIPALNVDSLKFDLVVIQNTCFEKEDSNLETASSKSVKENSLDFATKDLTLDYDSQMTDKYFVEYTGIEVKHFKETLLQHMGNVKKSVAERTRHQRHSGTKSEVQDDSSRSGNDTDADDVEIRPIYDKEPMVEVQLIAECNIFAIGQQHTEQPEIVNEGRVDHNKAKIKKEIDVLETMNIELEHSVAKLRKENETLKKHYKDLYDSIKITRSKTIEQTTSLLANNADLKAQIQEKVFAIAILKNDFRKLKGNSVDTKFAKTSVLGKPVLQSLRNQSVVRQPNAFKSERPQMSKQRFASQVDVNNNLSRPVTQHYLPKRRESAFAKPDHMIASSESRNSSKNMPRFSSNDMVHNHYLDEARKKTQERDRNSKTSVMPSARFQSTADGSKPKPRSNNQTPRSLPILPEHPGDTYVFTVKMEILLEPTSNKLLVGSRRLGQQECNKYKQVGQSTSDQGSQIQDESSKGDDDKIKISELKVQRKSSMIKITMLNGTKPLQQEKDQDKTKRRQSSMSYIKLWRLKTFKFDMVFTPNEELNCGLKELKNKLIEREQSGALTCQQKLKDLKIKLKEQEHNFNSTSLHLKNKELEDKFKDNE